MSRKPLTDASIRAAKPKAGRYRISDGRGLALEVSPAGGKHWRYRYEMAGKEYLYALGEWCTAPDGETAEQAEARRAAGRFTLAEARVERQRCRDMVKLGRHPLNAKKAERQARAHRRLRRLPRSAWTLISSSAQRSRPTSPAAKPSAQTPDPVRSV
jgi:hypothetical protein